MYKKNIKLQIVTQFEIIDFIDFKFVIVIVAPSIRYGLKLYL